MKVKTTVVVLLAILLASCASTSDPDFENKSKTAREFAMALLSADTESAKLLSTQAQWNKIDEWVKIHQPISCRAEESATARESLISSDLSGGSWFISGKFDEQSNEWLVDVAYECQTELSNYCFKMNNSRIEKINDEWQVVEWGVVCEKNNGSNPCQNMCQ